MPAPEPPVLPVSRLADMTAAELAHIAGEAVFVLPVGATEQHGPCLPLRTDSLLVETVLTEALARTRNPPRPIVQAPVLAFGHSQHHLFAAAASLRPETLLAVLGDLIDSARQSGFRRVLVVNGHGGNDECVRLAIKDAANRWHPMLLAACNYWELGDQEWRRGRAHIPGHAGSFETSLMLAAAPELVATQEFETAVPGRQAVHERTVAAGLTVARAGDWAASGGYTDTPAAATAERGGTDLDHLARRLTEAIDAFGRLALEPEGQDP